ncbi:MAG: UvrD-helicase domain-containing protein, partial [Clostridia bacterium]|nr:UvrD-helicase domain-containing protein [Clostridia bacterium]
IRAKNGEIIDYKNEYLGLKEYLSSEEIGGKDAENILDPYLREIVKSRKEEPAVKDIIETIQEKQYEIITSDVKKNFVLQGCAGSGKTMVMLHRLSYLMYNDESIRSKNVLVLTPSDSFNGFIDELAAVLELERVKTTTIHEYFLRVLDNEKISIREKIDYAEKENEDYLAYVYSPDFLKDVEKKLGKVYDNLYGLFTGEECQSFISSLTESCAAQLSSYEWIMNSSTRVRRAVLGEIKEKKEGGLYYTKPFRTLMNCMTDVRDFFTVTLRSERAKTPEYFYRHMLSFYKSAVFVRRYTERIVAEAVESLQTLKGVIEREIVDLYRYKKRVGEQELLVYPDRIERRKEILTEIEKTIEKTTQIADKNAAFEDFFEYLIGEKTFSAIGKGEDFVDVVRYFYRETVKKYKKRYGIQGKMYPSDAYALCVLCDMLGKDLTPKHTYVFVDEAQDLSQGEYRLLKRINSRACFNIFGDVEQNVTPYRGVKDWSLFSDFEQYTLLQNYRNTNQIVEYVSDNLQVNMQSIGLDGPNVESISARGIAGFFKEKKGLKAVICSEKTREKYAKKSYHVIAEKGKVSKTKINFMSVYESKGLEFSSVVVCTEGMTDAEKYIAYTRALQNLAVIEEE